MRGSIVVAGVALLAACSRPAPEQSGADLNSAAVHAQQDIANYAAATPSPVPTGSAPVAAEPAPTAPAPAPSPTPPAAPAAGSGAVEASALASRYFGMIDAGRYRQAWSLWRDGGKASGQTAAAFAASFAPYASYKATVGTPFDEDAGAGQRYITVPVTIAATRKRGRPEQLKGTLILHRVAEGIETDDPADHQWRIDRSTIAPVGGGSAR